ncbi:MAG: DsbA family protein [Vicinamibacteria bacterium]
MGRKAKKRKAPTPAAAAPVASSTNHLGVVVAALLLAGLAAAVVFVGRNTPEPEEAPPPAEASDVEKWERAPLREVSVAADDPALGPPGAPATIVEFSDFECPYCRDAARSLKEMKERYGDRLRLVFKDFPLDTACNPHITRQVHPLACRAAVVAACAGRQDRFWEMHDAVFSLPELTGEELDRLPESLGLDLAAFEECESDQASLASIRADIDTGRELGVSGTPALFVNGREAPGYRALGPIIERVLSDH